MNRWYLKIEYFDSMNDLYFKQTAETLGTGGDVEISDVISGLPQSLSQELDIKESTSTVSNIFIDLMNKDFAISTKIYDDFFNTDNFYNKKCEIGFYEETTPATKTVIYTGYFEDFTSDIYETMYTITLKDAIDKLKVSLLTKTEDGNDTFDVETLLSEEMPDTTDFTRFGRYELAGETASHLDNYKDVTDQTTFNNLTKTKWIILSITKHPLDLFEYFLSQLDVEWDATSFSEVKTDSKNSDISTFYFEWKKPISNVLEWSIKQILKPLNCFPIIKSDGKIYLKLHKQPTVDDFTIVLDDDNITKIKSTQISRDNIINNALVGIDYNIEKDIYLSQAYDIDNPNTTLDTDSVEAFGLKPKELDVIGFQGMNSKATIGGDTTFAKRLLQAREYIGYLFNRFALSVKIVELEILYSEGESVELGDTLILQSTKLLRWKGDGAGTTRGLPVVSTDEYGKVDGAFWGEYVETWEDNEFLSDKTANKSIEVRELITLEFFEGLLENYNYNLTFLTQHEREPVI